MKTAFGKRETAKDAEPSAERRPQPDSLGWITVQKADGKSKHHVLFLYSQSPTVDGGPAAARLGSWKAHWLIQPGLGGCSAPLLV